jgi:hypothetical protein
MIMPAFQRYPNEAAIIGRLLAGYGELEFLLCLVLSEAVVDLSTAARLLFRSRSEDHRLSCADALLRPMLDGYRNQSKNCVIAQQHFRATRSTESLAFTTAMH